MLPDFPKSKRELEKQLRIRMRKFVETHSPLMALAQPVTQHEGREYSYEQVGFGIISEGYQQAQAKIEIKFGEIPDLVGEKLLAKVDQAAGEIARQMAQFGYAKLDEAITKGGNKIDAQGQPFSQSMYLQMIERMEMGFDKRGKPTHTFITHPDMAKAIMAKMGEWEKDDAFQRKYKELMQRKREEFRDRESNRKLVD